MQQSIDKKLLSVIMADRIVLASLFEKTSEELLQVMFRHPHYGRQSDLFPT